MKWGGQEMQLLGEGLGILTLDTQQKQAFTPIPTTPLTIGLEVWLPDLHLHDLLLGLETSPPPVDS